MKYLYFIVIFTVFLGIIYSQEEEKEKNIVCYYTNWAPYRQGNAKFTPQNIDPFLCTHLIYAFAKFSNDLKLTPTDEYQDISNNGYQQFNALKRVNPNLKTLLSVGGWEEGSVRFSRIASTQEGRNKFTQSVIDLLRKYDFNGINIDWQFPSQREGSRPDDLQNCVKLVQSLRTAFENESKTSKKPRLLVTMSIPSEVEYIEQGYDLTNLQKYVDFFNVLSYDYHLSFGGKVNHHSPLYALPEEIAGNYNLNLNVDATVQYLLKNGLNKEKLILGIPSYGRTYKLNVNSNHAFGAESKGVRGESEKGFQPYYQTCKNIKDENWTVMHVNKSAIGPYAFKGDNWVGYDDEDIVRTKGAYARKFGLGGIMFWTVDDDDFNGYCGSRKFPLIRAGEEGLLGRTRLDSTRIPSTTVRSRGNRRLNLVTSKDVS